jgi:cytoskeletal protein RodZ
MKTTRRKNTVQPAKNSNKKKWFFLGLGLVATGVLTFFGVKYFQKNKKETQSNATAEKFKVPAAASSATKTKPKSAPKPKPAPSAKAAPKKSTKRTSGISKTSTQKTTQAKTASNVTGLVSSVLAKSIHSAVVKKDFQTTFALLRSIKNTKDYSAVSKVFSTFFLAGVRQTLVNGLLSTFKVESQKQALRKAFTAMGLKFDGKKWSLSGIDTKPLLITTGATSVWKDSKTSVPVPNNMVLGREIAKRGDHTLFENDKQFFLVESKYVNYYKS